MKKDLDVSVVIPVYNGEALLAEGIESVLGQTVAPLEIIVVDDGSTDGTATAARRFEDRVRYIYQENAGPAAARNLGIRMANGPVIAFLDADDLWPERKLEIQLAAFEKDPRLEAVWGMAQIMALSREERDERQFVDLEEPWFCPVLGNGLFKRPLFDRLGPLNEKMMFSEDTDWYLKILEEKVPMVILDEVTILYRRHEKNMTLAKSLSSSYFLRALKMSLDRRRKKGGGRAERLPDPHSFIQRKDRKEEDR